jgi:protein phosphatase-4 regulatory subunit 3
MRRADDGLSDEMIDPLQALLLPDPDMGNLADIENTMRMANSTTHGRDALARYVMSNDYISKLVPLVQMAEDFESLSDLHRLCNIMKTVILLNDNSIIEQVVKDELILGVVGALECEDHFAMTGRLRD